MAKDWRSVMQMFLGDLLRKRIPCRLTHRRHGHSPVLTKLDRNDISKTLHLLVVYVTIQTVLSLQATERATDIVMISDVDLSDVCVWVFSSIMSWPRRSQSEVSYDFRHESIIIVGSERLCSAERSSRLEEMVDRQDFSQRFHHRDVHWVPKDLLLEERTVQFLEKLRSQMDVEIIDCFMKDEFELVISTRYSISLFDDESETSDARKFDSRRRAVRVAWAEYAPTRCIVLFTDTKQGVLISTAQSALNHWVLVVPESCFAVPSPSGMRRSRRNWNFFCSRTPAFLKYRFHPAHCLDRTRSIHWVGTQSLTIILLISTRSDLIMQQRASSSSKWRWKDLRGFGQICSSSRLHGSRFCCCCHVATNVFTSWRWRLSRHVGVCRRQTVREHLYFETSLFGERTDWERTYHCSTFRSLDTIGWNSLWLILSGTWSFLMMKDDPWWFSSSVRTTTSSRISQLLIFSAFGSRSVCPSSSLWGSWRSGNGSVLEHD